MLVLVTRRRCSSIVSAFVPDSLPRRQPERLAGELAIKTVFGCQEPPRLPSELPHLYSSTLLICKLLTPDLKLSTMLLFLRP